MLAHLGDVLLIATLTLSFATLVTVHLAICARLALRARPRWRGLVGLVVPPAAVLWAAREGWRASVLVWLGSVATYALALTVAKL